METWAILSVTVAFSEDIYAMYDGVRTRIDQIPYTPEQRTFGHPYDVSRTNEPYAAERSTSPPWRTPSHRPNAMCTCTRASACAPLLLMRLSDALVPYRFYTWPLNRVLGGAFRMTAAEGASTTCEGFEVQGSIQSSHIKLFKNSGTAAEQWPEITGTPPIARMGDEFLEGGDCPCNGKRCPCDGRCGDDPLAEPGAQWAPGYSWENRETCPAMPIPVFPNDGGCQGKPDFTACPEWTTLSWQGQCDFLPSSLLPPPPPTHRAPRACVCVCVRSCPPRCCIEEASVLTHHARWRATAKNESHRAMMCINNECVGSISAHGSPRFYALVLPSLTDSTFVYMNTRIGGIKLSNEAATDGLARPSLACASPMHPTSHARRVCILSRSDGGVGLPNQLKLGFMLPYHEDPSGESNYW